LKTATWKKFTENDNHKWVALVPQLVERYNSTVHSGIGVTPDEASEKSASVKPDRVTGKAEFGKPKYELRDWVRISRIKDKFEKGYTHNWSKELYQIIRIVQNKPIM